MQLIVISPEKTIQQEQSTLIELFENGLNYFHLRKSEWNRKEMADYLQSIPKSFHPSIILHNHHDLINEFQLKGVHFSRHIPFKKSNALHQSISCHSFKEINEQKHPFDYFFLSPVFDSISKPGYSAAFDLTELSAELKSSTKNIIALGGIDEQNIEKAKLYGFRGVAILGALWKQDNGKSIVDKFKRIHNLCQTSVHTY